MFNFFYHFLPCIQLLSKSVCPWFQALNKPCVVGSCSLVSLLSAILLEEMQHKWEKQKFFAYLGDPVACTCWTFFFVQPPISMPTRESDRSGIIRTCVFWVFYRSYLHLQLNTFVLQLRYSLAYVTLVRSTILLSCVTLVQFNKHSLR